jgi:7,8-dihydropterin-6-yl-methyl-4-(beta-D-ribofuranosyl)aminobenzene 5'-phosphate synthase
MRSAGSAVSTGPARSTRAPASLALATPPCTGVFPAGTEQKGEMARQPVWMRVWTASLLLVGCAAGPVPEVSSRPATLAPTKTPDPIMTLTRTPDPTPMTTETADPTSMPTEMPDPTLTPIAMPDPTPTPEVTPLPPLSEEGETTVTFTVVYDNNGYDPDLHTAWGFSCWVEAGEATLLFDTGGDTGMLLDNLAKLGLDPHEIDAVVLSHAHGDHTGGLAGLLDEGIRPTVYVPSAFPDSFVADVRARTDLVKVTAPLEVAPGVYTTGQLGSRIVEQALVVQTAAGLVVVTGCAHPGIVAMVRRAKEVTDGQIALVMGGFHLGGASERQIEDIIAEFRALDVQRLAPCHCTGDPARRMFVDAYGPACTLAGAGWAIGIDPYGAISDLESH